jgi:hypothetical protein
MASARSAAAAAALLALGAAGCGGSQGSVRHAPGAAAQARSSAPAAPLSTADLQARLLTLADMPAGFVADADTTDVNGTMSATDPACAAMTGLMNSHGHPAGSVGDADASFTRTELGPNIATGLASFGSAEAAQNLLDTVTKAMQSCPTLTETDKDGSTYDFAVSPLSFPRTGDASTATRIIADIGGAPAQVDLVLARVGSTLLYVANTGLGSTDPDLTQQVVTRAVAKVENPAAKVTGL